MASSASALTIFFLLSLSLSLSHGQTSFRPKALLLPVLKDAATNQYVTTINQRLPLKLVVDIGGHSLWVDADNGYTSTYSAAQSKGCGHCFSAPRPGCNNTPCGVFLENTVTHTSTGGELAEDVLSVQSTDGSNPGRDVTVRRFLYFFAPTIILEGLASGVHGMAGLGRNRIGVTSQLAAAFSFPPKCTVCLSSSNGAIFFGDGPYVFLPGVDASSSLNYTRLLINPVATAGQGEPSDEYFIGVKSIRVNGNTVAINSTLLSIDGNGVGGTKISSVTPYTTLESTIYRAVTDAFIKETNLKRVAAVAPFGVCFSLKNVGSTRVGPAVSAIDLVLQRKSVYWRILGANSVVEVNEEVMCLAFLDGGSNPRTSVVIGGYQLEDILLQFDLGASRLGFSSSLLLSQTSCANFNFTSNT